MKILFLSLVFALSGQLIIAAETNKLDEESCGILFTMPVRVKQCRLSPDTDKLLKCGVVLRKLAKEQARSDYLDFAFKAEAKAQEAWNRGEKMMIEREPFTKKERCGYYLDCLTSYIDSLPMSAPDGRPLKHEQFEIWQHYDKIRLECANGAYTVTTGIKKVEEKSPNFKRWKGKNAPMLSRITVQESKQVIFIDPKSGEIINVPFPESATSDRTSQKYVFDSHKCLFKLKEEDERDKHINTAPVYVFSSDGKGKPQRDMKFRKNTDINFKISHIEPILQIKWRDVKNFVPTFHKTGTYLAKNILLNEQIFRAPKELRQVMTVKNIVAARTLLNPFQPIDSKELCDIQMGVEFLDGHIIWRQAEKVAYDYDIDFRPAEKWERTKALKIIRRMKNWSGSYTEEKQIYDGLNNPFHASDYKGQKRESYDGKEEPTGILDVIIDKDIKADDEPDEAEKIYNDSLDEISIDDLKMFTN